MRWQFEFRLRGRLPGSSSVSSEYWSRCTNTKLASRDLYRRQELVLDRLVGEFVRPEHRVLDLGCGDGEVARRIAPHCSRLLGVDLSDALVRKARRETRSLASNNLCFERHDLTVSLPDWTCSVVLALGVFCCLPEDTTYEAVLDRIAGRIPPGGLLILRETVSTGPPFTRQAPNGYVGRYRERSTYVRNIERRGFRLRANEEVARSPRGEWTHEFWVFERAASDAPLP